MIRYTIPFALITIICLTSTLSLPLPELLHNAKCELKQLAGIKSKNSYGSYCDSVELSILFSTNKGLTSDVTKRLARFNIVFW